MEKTIRTKRILSAALTVIMLLAVCTTAASAQEAKGSFTVAVEAFAIGNGYVINPVNMEITQGENGAQVLDKVLAANGIGHNYGGSLTESYYLKSLGFKNTDKIPQCVLDEIGDNIDEGTPDSLGEQDYTALAGWLYTVNGKPIQTMLCDYYPAQGDVLRVQFSLWYGAEVGLANAMEMDKWMGISDFYPVSDKEELTVQIANINADKAALADETIKTAYDSALTAAETLNAGQPAVNKALYALTLAQDKTAKPGDLDKSGEPDVGDVLTIQKYLAEVMVLPLVQRAQADFNTDGVISVQDVVALQRLIAKV